MSETSQSATQRYAPGAADDRGIANYQRVWVDGLNRGDVSGADVAFAPDCVVHFTGVPEPLRGLDALKQHVAGFLTAFPDLRLTIDESLVDGDRVAHRFHATGTHTGPLGPVPPTGRRIEIDALIVDHVVNGRVAERWEQIDQSRMLQQLGLG